MNIDLVYKFWHLSPLQRHKILEDLNLIDETNRKLPEQQKVLSAFKKARELNIIKELKKVIMDIFLKESI